MDAGGKNSIEMIAELLWEASGAHGAHPWDRLPDRPKAVMVAVAYRVVNAVNVAHQILSHERPDDNPPDVATKPTVWN